MDSLTIHTSLYENHKERNDCWIKVAERLYQVRQALKQIQQEENKILQSLKLLSGNTSSRGGNFIFTKTMRSGFIDYSTIPQLQGINLDHYRKKDIETWKLDIVLTKKETL